MTLTAFQQELCTSSRWDFSDLRALFVNCTLKPGPEPSHTQALMDVALLNNDQIDYTPAEHGVWQTVWEKLSPLPWTTIKPTVSSPSSHPRP